MAFFEEIRIVPVRSGRYSVEVDLSPGVQIVTPSMLGPVLRQLGQALGPEVDLTTVSVRWNRQSRREELSV